MLFRSYRIVEALDGSITIEEGRELGTRFFIKIPGRNITTDNINPAYRESDAPGGGK